jgi:hypothetical protein
VFNDIESYAKLSLSVGFRFVRCLISHEPSAVKNLGAHHP